MVVTERGRERVPVPRALEAVGVEDVEELDQDPLLHELLKRRAAGRERSQVVHAKSRQHAEQVPGTPEPFVDEPLRVFAIALGEDLEHRPADLRMARLVGLDALHHRLEHRIAGVARERRKRDELQVGEARLEHQVRPDRELDRIGRQQQLVHQVPGRDRHPVVGVVEAVHPVELRVPLHEIVEEEQRDLGVPELVQRPEQRHRAPGAVAREAARAQVSDRRRELRERQRRAVELVDTEPRRRHAPQLLGPADGVAHRAHRALLLTLGRDVLAIARPIGLVPLGPGRRRHTSVAARLGREELRILHVPDGPVELARQIEPRLAREHPTALDLRRPNAARRAVPRAA